MTISIRRILTMGAVAISIAATSAEAASQFALGLQIGASDGGNFSGLTARVGQEKTIEGILAIDHKDWIVNGNYLVHSSS
ncbi:MAG: hypothetical protein RL173_721, partial [Fibrobacterota bacterium]